MFYFLVLLFLFFKNLFFNFLVLSKENFNTFIKYNLFLNKQKNKKNILFDKLFFLKKKNKSNIKKKKCKFNIVIDPGHGGHDPGAIGINGTKEKDINLLISKKLFKFLSLDKRFNVSLIRTKDNYISLQERLRIVHNKKANLFLSIHVNSIHNNRYIKGASIWLLSMLNKYKYITKMNYLNLDKNQKLKLNYFFLNLSKKVSQLNYYLASEIINEFRNSIILHKNYLQYADFFILSLFYIPSILIEVGYISNPIEEKKLVNEFYQYKLAKYIYLGVNNFTNNICMFKYKYNEY